MYITPRKVVALTRESPSGNIVGFVETPARDSHAGHNTQVFRYGNQKRGDVPYKQSSVSSGIPFKVPMRHSVRVSWGAVSSVVGRVYLGVVGPSNTA